MESSVDLALFALSDPTRRAIVGRLAEGEARVTELAAPFALSLNAVSKHIRTLERANLVRRRRAGREHFISLDREALAAAMQWMEEQRSAWLARLDALDEVLEEDGPATTGGEG